MESKTDILTKYQLFSSPNRGEPEVEAELALLLKSMTTPANVKKLEPLIEGPLGLSADKLRSLREAFKRIDEEGKSAP